MPLISLSFLDVYGQTSYEHLMNLLQTFYEIFMSFLQTSNDFLKVRVILTYKPS